MYKQFVIESNGKVFREVTSLEDSRMEGTPVSIIRLNANTSVYVSGEDWQKCIPGPTKTSIQVIHSTDKIAYFKSMEEGKTCDEIRDKTKPYQRTNNTVFNIDYFSNGAAWDFNNGMLNPGCECTTLESRVLKKEGVKEVEMISTDGDYDDHAFEINDLYDKSMDPILKQERLKDNARTTSSVLSRFKDYLLLNIQPPSIHVPTFEYIEYGKSVLIKKCPEINKHVVESLVKILKILLANVIGRFPETYPNNMDVNTHGRIIKSLQSCLHHQDVVNFTWDNTTCDGIKEVIVNGSSIPINIPDHVKFYAVPQTTDVVLELAWKLILLAHYACTGNFESHPDDLSFMYVKAQEFLTIPYIMFRWENPSSSLTTAYKLLLPDLKLSKLAEQVDACVFSAFSSSIYKSWVNRPKSTSEFLRENIVSRSMDKLTHQDQDSKLMFNNKGYCVHNFNDPLKWTAVNAGVDATC
ncbi:unnamed protein product [Orchesella dallaii]|uniref:Uncharacterized protein n=1 Tax=Orchesella dallaii TaxID=48710 RepID=A0ABP1QWP2_9HEXA